MAIKKTKKNKVLKGGFGLKSKVAKSTIRSEMTSQLKEKSQGQPYNPKLYSQVVKNVSGYLKTQKYHGADMKKINVKNVVKRYINSINSVSKPTDLNKQGEYVNLSGKYSYKKPQQEQGKNGTYLTIEAEPKHTDNIMSVAPSLDKRFAPAAPDGSRKIMKDGKLVSVTTNQTYLTSIPQEFKENQYVPFKPLLNKETLTTLSEGSEYTKIENPNVSLIEVIKQNKLNQLSNEQLKTYLQNQEKTPTGRLLVTSNQRSQISNILTERKYRNTSNATLNRTLKNRTTNSLGFKVISNRERGIINKIIRERGNMSENKRNKMEVNNIAAFAKKVQNAKQATVSSTEPLYATLNTHLNTPLSSP
jgi:hypothetical protein